MAQSGRGEITTITSNNIFDNEQKEIDPSMVRAVINALRDSYFNLVDDFLKDVQYDSTTTLETKINAGGEILLHSVSSNITILSANDGVSYNGSGDANFYLPANGRNGAELALQVTFPTISDNYIPLINVEITGTPWYENNAVVTSWGLKTSSSLNIYVQRIFDDPTVKIHLTLLKVS